MSITSSAVLTIACALIPCISGTPDPMCSSAAFTPDVLARFWYVFEITAEDPVEAGARLLPADDVEDAASLARAIAADLGIRADELVLRSGSIRLSSDFCRVATDEVPAVGVRYCHRAAGGLRTHLISGVTPPGGGIVLLTSEIEGHRVALAQWLVVKVASSNHPELKMLEMREDADLEEIAEDLRDATVEGASFPEIELSAYGDCD